MANTTLSAAAREFLQEPRFAVLATINQDGTPQQSTVWYDVQGDLIMMNTRRGRLKDRNMRRDPRVSFCVEDGYRYIAIRGRVEIIDDQSVAQPDIAHLAERYSGREQAEQQVRNQFSQEERVTLVLTAERIDAYGL